jgi:Ca2+-binding RTX toxin-like protein
VIPLAAAATITLGGLFGLTSANTVPSTKVDVLGRAITANTLKPTECAGITLTNLVTGSGTINGTTAADLILGSAAVDTISGGTGTDCILGGGSNDSINGGAGADVCIGGPGPADTFTNCETQYQ